MSGSYKIYRGDVFYSTWEPIKSGSITDKELSEIYDKVNIEVDNIIAQFEMLQKVGANFLDSLADRLRLKIYTDNEKQISCFMRQPIEELFQVEEDEYYEALPDLVINGVRVYDFIYRLV